MYVRAQCMRARFVYNAAHMYTIIEKYSKLNFTLSFLYANERANMTEAMLRLCVDVPAMRAWLARRWRTLLPSSSSSSSMFSLPLSSAMSLSSPFSGLNGATARSSASSVSSSAGASAIATTASTSIAKS